MLLLALITLAGATAIEGLPEVRILEGAPLPEVPVSRSKGGLLDVTLVVEPVRIVGRDFDIVTRAFNQSLPAPTLAVLPGDRLSIRLINGLQKPDGTYRPNVEHHANETNIHLHGLHISPLAPADDVLGTLLRPGSTWQYEYQILPDHSPGTYWYHPHHHGSVLLQAGAGAAGALLVEDPPNFLPAELEGMPDRVLVIQHMEFGHIHEAAAVSGDDLFKINRMPAGGELLLVNGVQRPVLTMAPWKWHRLRFIMAGMTQWIIVDFGACEAALLAKDGIYIYDFPRVVGRATLPPGGRMDAMVRCPQGAGGTPATHVVTSVNGPMKNGVAVGKVGGSIVADLFTVRVEGPINPPFSVLENQALGPWSPPTRPAYLRNLMSDDSPRPQCACMTTLGIKPGDKKMINGRWWQGGHHGPTTFIHQSPRNVAVERLLVGTDTHIYHQHTFPFQLGDVPPEDPFFQLGDWHDSYLNVWTQNVTVRFNTADWHGPMVLHCHDYTHEDGGMMAQEFVGSKSCQCDPGYDVVRADRDVGAPAIAKDLEGLSSESEPRGTGGNSPRPLFWAQWPLFWALATATIVFFAGLMYLGTYMAASAGQRRCCSRDYQALPGLPQIQIIQ